MQALYLLALDPISETSADRNSYGFRPVRSAADAIEQCFVNLSRKSSAEWVLEGDIKGVLTISAITGYLPTFRWTNRYSGNGLKRDSWSPVGYTRRRLGHHREALLPRTGEYGTGWAGSGVRNPFWEEKPQSRYKTKVNYVRYADDFIITGISKELLEDEFKPFVEAFMAERGLQLSPEKQ